jgi:dTDP-4-dehydrorhamnose 3,5-epimerase
MKNHKEDSDNVPSDVSVICTDFDDCFLVSLSRSKDSRGSFIKTYNEQIFKQLHLNTFFKDEFVSVSRKDTLRGFHIQLAPFDGGKLIRCLSGSAYDVALDLRKKSNTFGKTMSYLLTPDSPSIYICAGVAHAFYALSDNTVMHYKCEADYNHERDVGILWSSVDLKWPDEPTYISTRDQQFPELEHFLATSAF